MNRVKKMYYRAKYWGIKYCYYMYIYDIFFHTDKASKFMYDYNAKISSGEYADQLKKIYHIQTGKKLNLDNPDSFNEKIQWLKIYDTTSLKTQLTDKYLVRKWVEEKIGKKYLIPLIGKYDSLDELDIDSLPEKFVLKTNHGSGFNIVVKNKEELNWIEVKKTLEKWLSINFAWVVGLELQYKNIKPCIMVEQYIQNAGNPLFDYKIFCFNGKAKYIHVISDRDVKSHSAKEAFYDVEWKRQNFTTYTYPQYEKNNTKPKNLKEMIIIAEKLAEKFIYVRVDLYELDNGNIKFGEMTFTPGSGFYDWKPEETDFMLGNMMTLYK